MQWSIAVSAKTISNHNSSQQAFSSCQSYMRRKDTTKRPLTSPVNFCCHRDGPTFAICFWFSAWPELGSFSKEAFPLRFPTGDYSDYHYVWSPLRKHDVVDPYDWEWRKATKDYFTGFDGSYWLQTLLLHFRLVYKYNKQHDRLPLWRIVSSENIRPPLVSSACYFVVPVAWIDRKSHTHHLFAVQTLDMVFRFCLG